MHNRLRIIIEREIDKKSMWTEQNDWYVWLIQIKIINNFVYYFCENFENNAFCHIHTERQTLINFDVPFYCDHFFFRNERRTTLSDILSFVMENNNNCEICDVLHFDSIENETTKDKDQTHSLRENRVKTMWPDPSIYHRKRFHTFSMY